MADRIDARLAELNIKLPEATAPVANYVPYVVTGNLVYLAGQIPVAGGKVQYAGKVGRDLTVEQGQQAARLCALNLLAQLKAACGGDLDRVVRCVKIQGFVQATDDFTDHPKVINGVSDLMVALFGEAGRHARFAVGADSLPLGVAVEIDSIFEIT